MGQHARHVPGKVSQQFVLGRREPDDVAAAGNQAGRQVNTQVPNGDQAAFAARGFSVMPESHPDAGQQFVDAKGFCQLIIRAGI